MNNMKFFVATLSLVTFSVACSSKPKVATQQAPTTTGKSFAQYKEPTMVNVVTVTRYPASEDGLKDISKKDHPQ